MNKNINNMYNRYGMYAVDVRLKDNKSHTTMFVCVAFSYILHILAVVYGTK